METKKIKTSTKKSGSGFDLKPYMIVIGILLIGLVIFAGFRMNTSKKHLIPISVLAIIAGVLFEGRRLSEKWKPVLLTALGSFVISFVAFFPGKHERHYDLETHIQIWPYWFIIVFALLSVAFHGEKVIPKLTEGITLLQSIAVIYWVVDYGFIDINNYFLIVLMIVGLLFSLYSVLHAFTHIILARKSRLVLSLWSSIIMLLFASDNIYRVYQNEQIENTEDITHGLYIGLQYFLLGISCIYIVQNFLMIMGFLPGKGTFFNAQYYRDIKVLKDSHVKRYSDRQVSIFHSFFCVFFTGTIFGLNYYFQIIPRHVAIWVAFVIFPFILMFYEYLMRKKSPTMLSNL